MENYLNVSDMKSVIFVFRFRFSLPSIFLRARRDVRDPAAAPIPLFGERDNWRRVGELGDELTDKRNKGNLVSFCGLSGQLSSVSDGARDDEYADCRSGNVGQVMSESLRDNDLGDITDTRCLVDVDVEFGNNKE